MTKDVRTTQRSCTKYQNTNLGHLCTKMFIAVEEGKTQTMYSIKSFSLIIIRKAEELPWSFPESFQEWVRHSLDNFIFESRRKLMYSR